nr:2-oxoacid:acceptor oxidoreductase family protein [Haliscomenobacter sp.]
MGENTNLFAQGYFVYDSKKSGSQTVSHLRFGKNPIKSPYLVQKADFLACHKFNFVQKVDMLRYAKPGATFLLNSPYDQDEIWEQLPTPVQQDIIAKNIRFYVIDASKVAEEVGMGNRINTIMQVCFLRSQAYCHVKKPSPKSNTRSRRPTVKKVRQWSNKTTWPLIQPCCTCMR